MGAFLGRFGLGLSLLGDLVGKGLSVLAPLVEHGANLILGGQKLLAVLREKGFPFIAGPLGLLKHVEQVFLAMMHRLQQWSPGEFTKDEQEADKDKNRPDRQRWLWLKNIGVASRLMSTIVRGGGVRVGLGGFRAGGGLVKGSSVDREGQDQRQAQSRDSETQKQLPMPMPGHGSLRLAGSKK